MTEPFENNLSDGDPDFIDHLLATNREFRDLMEARRNEADDGQMSSLDSVRDHLQIRRGSEL
jgi:hypothetical protein